MGNYAFEESTDDNSGNDWNTCGFCKKIFPTTFRVPCCIEQIYYMDDHDDRMFTEEQRKANMKN